MQIVIELDDKTYQRCVESDLLTIADLNKFIVAIGIGTPLPKGHGRLIDADALPLNAIDDANHGSNYIRIAPTIIEADKEMQE